jgi:2-dehydropantoate 2-reductase
LGKACYDKLKKKTKEAGGKMKTIGILGMGAIGGMLASHIVDHGSDTVYILGDEERIERYNNQNWICVNGKEYTLMGMTPKNAEILDLIILAVKYHHLKEVIPFMAPFIGDHTTIVSLMNGIDSENLVGEVYGMDKIVHAFIVAISAVKKGRAIQATAGEVVFNSIRGDQEKVAALSSFFKRNGISHRIPDDILKEIWWKFMINVGVNQVSAVLDAPYGDCQSIEPIGELIDAAMMEVIELSKYEKVHLTMADLERWHLVLQDLAPEGLTSMLQDMRARRKTEVEMFAGVVQRLGIQHGYPTPVNDVLFHLIKAKEAQEGV